MTFTREQHYIHAEDRRFVAVATDEETAEMIVAALNKLSLPAQNLTRRRAICERIVLASPLPRAIGPDSDSYHQFLNTRADLEERLRKRAFTRSTGYEIWRNAWLACERAHGVRKG